MSTIVKKVTIRRTLYSGCRNFRCAPAPLCVRWRETSRASLHYLCSYGAQPATNWTAGSHSPTDMKSGWMESVLRCGVDGSP